MNDSKLVQEKWNSISLGSGAVTNPYTISSHAVSTAWYNTEINEASLRNQRLRNYVDADNKSVDISRSIDVIAEDISGCNADNSDLFRIDYPEDSKVGKARISLANHALKMWQNRTEFDEYLFDRTRLTLLLGATFYEINSDGSLTYLPSEKFVGYKVSASDNKTITHYVYDDSRPAILDMGFENSKANGDKFTTYHDDKKEYRVYSVDDLLIMKVGNGPFGESLVKKVYTIWRQMEMLERSVVIYRITRSSEKRVYYIDTGNLAGRKRDSAIHKQQIRLKQKKTNSGGELLADYSPETMGEDIFIPTSSSGRGSKVETLQGGSNLGEMEDVKWFANKLKDGMRVPDSIIGSASSDNQSTYNDMRVGQSLQVEIRYMGMCKRHKRRLNIPLKENFVKFCSDRGITLHPDMEFSIEESNSFSEYRDMEKNQMLLNMFNSTTQINSLSGQLALSKYLNFDKDDIERNQYLKLKEMGLDDETINSMEEHEVYNLVYAKKPNKETLEKYGITVDDSGGFGGF